MNESFIPLPSGFGAFLALPLVRQDLRGVNHHRHRFADWHRQRHWHRVSAFEAARAHAERLFDKLAVPQA
jgi:hypothetical protein